VISFLIRSGKQRARRAKAVALDTKKD